MLPSGGPARDWLAANGLLFPLLGVNRWLLRQAVTGATDVCLEGYPRSGNSFTWHAFRGWNPGARIAHHLHTPLQIKRAVRLGVPCAVLIRPPLDPVASVLAMDRERISGTAGYESYIRFYSRALPVHDRVVVAPFAEVTKDPATMIRRLNTTFGTSFAGEQMTLEEKAAIMRRMERLRAAHGRPAAASGVPSAEKDRRRMEHRERLAEHRLLSEAEQLYDAWVGPGRHTG